MTAGDGCERLVPATTLIFSKVIMPENETGPVRESSKRILQACIVTRVGEQPQQGKGLA